MTVLENSIRIEASAEAVWAVLASLETLEQYDPGVKKSQVVSETQEGPGAARRCYLTPGGWFEERIAEWEPARSISFELFRCTLPVRRLQHRYTLTSEGGGTVVHQRMEYELKFGALGRLLDALVMRRQWDRGVKGFFAGLKRHVESIARP